MKGAQAEPSDVDARLARLERQLRAEAAAVEAAEEAAKTAGGGQ